MNKYGLIVICSCMLMSGTASFASEATGDEMIPTTQGDPRTSALVSRTKVDQIDSAQFSLVALYAENQMLKGKIENLKLENARLHARLGETLSDMNSSLDELNVSVSALVTPQGSAESTPRKVSLYSPLTVKLNPVEDGFETLGEGFEDSDKPTDAELKKFWLSVKFSYGNYLQKYRRFGSSHEAVELAKAQYEMDKTRWEEEKERYIKRNGSKK